MNRNLSAAIEQWLPVRDSTIDEIQKTIENLRIHHRNVNISRITGSTVSVVGSAMAITGFILAPFTFGASIGLSVSGVALAVAGGGTAAGASVADLVIQKSNVKYAQELLTCDYKQLNIISEIAGAIRNEIEDVRRKSPDGISATQFVAVFGEVFTQGVVRTSYVGVRIAELAVSGIGAAVRGVAAAGIILNLIMIPLDLIEIVRSSISLAKGSRTKAMNTLTNVVVQLKQQKLAITELLQEQTRATARREEEHVGYQMRSICKS